MTDGLRLLLVATGRNWISATQGAISLHGGGTLDRVASGPRAVSRLLGGRHAYSHVLVQPRCSDGLLPELYSLTDGEQGSATRLILLGADGLPSALGVPLVSDTDPAAILHVLVSATPPLPGPPEWEPGELRDAISGPMVQARYQPFVRMADGACLGLEVLARLHHPDHGWVRPAGFVAQVEEAGFATRLTDTVAQRAFGELADPIVHERELALALNFPLDVFTDPRTVPCLDRHRAASGFPAERIIVELVETSPVEDMALMRRAVERLRLAGYGVAIDDFSPALPYQEALLELPFTTLKLDVEVVRGVHDGEGRAYMAHVVGAARRCGLTVVAEGVEDRSTWHALKELGVDQAQGFLVSRPLPHRALPTWLARWPERRRELAH